MRRGLLIGALASAAMAQQLPKDRSIQSDANIRLIAFADGGKALAATCGDGKLRIWDVESGAPRQVRTDLKLDPASTFGDRSSFVAAVSQNKIRVRDVVATSPIRDYEFSSVPRRVALSQDGALLATAYIKELQTGVNTIEVRDATGKDRFRTTAGLGGVSVLRFSPDGLMLVAGSNDADVRVWNTRNGELVRLIEELPVTMFAASFSPDGRWLATAGVDRIVYLWDAKSWKLVRKITGQPEMISVLDFSPDGRRLVTGGFSELTAQHPVSLVLWDVPTAKQLRSMPAPKRVAAVAFSPDGKRIASTTGGNTIELWQVPE